MTPPTSAFSPTYFATGAAPPDGPSYSLFLDETFSQIAGANRSSNAQYCADAFTWEGWFRHTGSVQSAGKPVCHIFSVFNTSGATGQAWRIDARYNGGAPDIRVVYVEVGGGLADLRWSYSLTADTWFHIALSVDTAQSGATNEAKLYIDTADQGAPTVAADSGVDDIRDAVTTTQLRLGQLDNAVAGRYFDAYYSDLRYWSDIRSGAEIAAAWKTKPAGTEPNLVDAWLLDNSYATAVSGGTNMGALFGSPTFVEGVVPY